MNGWKCFGIKHLEKTGGKPYLSNGDMKLKIKLMKKMNLKMKTLLRKKL